MLTETKSQVEADLGGQGEHLDVEVVLAGSILVDCVGLLKTKKISVWTESIIINEEDT